MVSWWQDGFSVASWLVAKLPGGEMTGYRDKGRDNKAHTHTIHIYLPFTRKSKDVEIKRCENCSSRNLTYKFCTGTH